VTGGSPISHGLFYDVSYNRSIFDPTNTTCSGQAGNMQVFDESIDKYSGTPPVSLNVIDPNALPNHLDENGNCVRLFPHNAMKSNTIFEVVKANGGHTAWADKHPAYDIANGPSGKGVDDLYTPEITNFGGFDNTVSVVCTVELSTDNAAGGCADDTMFTGKPGGYKDGLGTPTDVLEYALEQTDAALASMIQGLKVQHIYDSTLFIVSAKHGQSPINPTKINKPGHFADLVAALPDAATNGGAIAIANANACNPPAQQACGFVQDDDIALIWLADQNQTAAAAAYLNANANALFIDEVMAGNEFNLKFNSPLTDNATPDIIVQPIYGTVYTHSTAKNAEHGGFSFGDTNVGLIVSNPALHSRVVKTPVATSQVAASLLRALGIDPSELQAVQKEGTEVLPFLFGGDGK
jgi:hypothetical protein